MCTKIDGDFIDFSLSWLAWLLDSFQIFLYWLIRSRPKADQVTRWVDWRTVSGFREVLVDTTRSSFMFTRCSVLKHFSWSSTFNMAITCPCSKPYGLLCVTLITMISPLSRPTHNAPRTKHMQRTRSLRTTDNLFLQFSAVRPLPHFSNFLRYDIEFRSRFPINVGLFGISATRASSTAVSRFSGPPWVLSLRASDRSKFETTVSNGFGCEQSRMQRMFRDSKSSSTIFISLRFIHHTWSELPHIVVITNRPEHAGNTAIVILTWILSHSTWTTTILGPQPIQSSLPSLNDIPQVALWFLLLDKSIESFRTNKALSLSMDFNS